MSADRRKSAWALHAACWLLVLATLLAYEPVRSNGFIRFDDGVYITENEHVRGGPSPSALVWAFNVGHAGNWHPLTWLSHMVDCGLWGLDPAAHHLTSLALHAASSVLLLLLLWRTTGRVGASAFVAGVFALHPLHVESVAWAAERKDVLSALFAFLCLHAWVDWTRRGGRARYALALGLFALGLMAKPMLVSLPLALLLFDLWPLARWRLGARDALRLAREKLPFFALAAASTVVTIVAQRRGGAVTSIDVLPLSARLANAAVAYVAYVGKAFWPSRLSVFYPHPMGGIPAWEALGSAALLLVATAFALARVRARPWLAVGWLWFVLSLLPVIGLVQVGQQSMADRYAYLPLVGLSIVVAWGSAELLPRAVGGVTAVVALLLCGLLARRQVGFWRDDLTLFGHATEVTQDNAMARYQLGVVLDEQGRPEESIAQYMEALRIQPGDARVHVNLGMVLTKQGRQAEAADHYRTAVRLAPDLPEARLNHGMALDDGGELDLAIEQYEAALRLRPEFAEAHNDLGVTLGKLGRMEEAVGHFEAAVRLKRDYADAHMNLGVARLFQARHAEAVLCFETVLRLRPEHPQAGDALGTARAALERERAAPR